MTETIAAAILITGDNQYKVFSKSRTKPHYLQTKLVGHSASSCRHSYIDMSFLIENILKQEKQNSKFTIKSNPKSETFHSSGQNIKKEDTEIHDKQESQFFSERNYPIYPLPHRFSEAYLERALTYPYIHWSTHFYPVPPPISLLLFPHNNFKRKGGQVRFTANQTDALEKRFGTHKYLSPEERKTLADSLKLTDRQVKTWFQNRRAKWRRCSSSSSPPYSSDTKSHKHIYVEKVYTQ